ESILELFEGFCSVDDVVKNAMHHHVMRNAQPDEIGPRIYRPLFDQVRPLLQLYLAQIKSDIIHAPNTRPNAFQFGGFRMKSDQLSPHEWGRKAMRASR